VTPPDDAFEAGIQVAQAFERHAVPYALGGALAYGQYGIPRATNDVDVNVFVGPDELAEVFGALRTLGITIDETAARAASEEQGLIVLRFGGFRLDVFTPSIEFSWEAGRTRVQQTVDGISVWFLSVEALCVFKLLFFRGKDIVDLERLVAVSGNAIDAAYVRDHIVAMLGADDPRVARWDALWREHGPL
jgi:hypothetical protein